MPRHNPNSGASAGAWGLVALTMHPADLALIDRRKAAIAAPLRQRQSGQLSGHSSGHGSSSPESVLEAAWCWQGAVSSSSSACAVGAPESQGQEIPQVEISDPKAPNPPSPAGPQNSDSTSVHRAATRRASKGRRGQAIRSGSIPRDGMRVTSARARAVLTGALAGGSGRARIRGPLAACEACPKRSSQRQTQFSSICHKPIGTPSGVR